MGIVSVSPSRLRDAADKASLSFFQSDMPVLREQLGTPVVSLDGTVLGLVIESTDYGCKVLASDSVATRVKLMQSEQLSFAAHASEVHGEADSAYPSDATERRGQSH